MAHGLVHIGKRLDGYNTSGSVSCLPLGSRDPDILQQK